MSHDKKDSKEFIEYFSKLLGPLIDQLADEEDKQNAYMEDLFLTSATNHKNPDLSKANVEAVIDSIRAIREGRGNRNSQPPVRRMRGDSRVRDRKKDALRDLFRDRVRDTAPRESTKSAREAEARQAARLHEEAMQRMRTTLDCLRGLRTQILGGRQEGRSGRLLIYAPALYCSKCFHEKEWHYQPHGSDLEWRCNFLHGGGEPCNCLFQTSRPDAMFVPNRPQIGMIELGVQKGRP
jgi:hypothetical protein